MDKAIYDDLPKDERHRCQNLVCSQAIINKIFGDDSYIENGSGESERISLKIEWKNDEGGPVLPVDKLGFVVTIILG